MSLALIAYSEDVPKTLDMFKNLKTEPESINSFTYDCALKAVTLNVNGLSDQLDDIFEHLLKRKRLVLTSVQVDASFRVLRRLQKYDTLDVVRTRLPKSSNTFCCFKTTSQQPKNRKCTISWTIARMICPKAASWIPLISSSVRTACLCSKREKERIEFRKVHFEEEEKVKKLEEIRKSKYTLETDKSKEKSAEKAGE